MSVLALEKVNYAYEKMARKLLENVTIEFEGGKFYAILGGSGAGKSTLLGLLAGLDIPTSGKILCNGKDISEEGLPKHRKRNVSLVFQNYNLIDYLTPLENLRLVNHRADAGVLEKMGLEKEEINRNVMKLSGGQQQRVAIVRAIATNPELLLLDEITASLDPEIVREVLDVVLELAADGMTMLIVTHEMPFARAIADRVVLMDAGRIVEIAPPEKFFTDPETERARAFLKTFEFDSVHQRKN